MMKITGKRTVPQIFIGENHIGGFDELRKIDLSGELDRILGI
jgi:glutaredoxin 3